MEQIGNVWDFIKTHWDSFVELVGYIVAFATIVVGMTKSAKDDAFLGKLKKYWFIFSLINEDGTPCKKDK